MPETHREPYAFNHNKSKHYLDEDLADLADAKTNINNIKNYLGSDLIIKKSFSVLKNVANAGHGAMELLSVDIRQSGYIPIAVSKLEFSNSSGGVSNTWIDSFDKIRITKQVITSSGFFIIDIVSVDAVNDAIKTDFTIVYIKDPSSLVA